jgi:hypothetical protein
MFMMYGIITTIIQSDRDGAPLDGGTVGGGGRKTKPEEEREREKTRKGEARGVPRGTRNALTLFYTKRPTPSPSDRLE